MADQRNGKKEKEIRIRRHKKKKDEVRRQESDYKRSSSHPVCTRRRHIGLAYGLRRKAREDTQAGFSVSCFPTSLLLYFPSGQPLVIQPSDLPPGNRYFIPKSQLIWEEALGRCLGLSLTQTQVSHPALPAPILCLGH